MSRQAKAVLVVGFLTALVVLSVVRLYLRDTQTIPQESHLEQLLGAVETVYSGSDILRQNYNITLANNRHIWNSLLVTKSNSTTDSTYDVAIGVPSVRRPGGAIYLMDTLSSLVDNTTPEERKRAIILVFLLDSFSEYNNQICRHIENKYHDLISIGFLSIIQTTNDTRYPTLEGLPRNLGDSSAQVKWRSKQVMDFSLMFSYSVNISQYYLQIEDDVVCADRYLTLIREFINEQNKATSQWTVLEFSELGFIGKLFKSTDLEKLAEFMEMFYYEQPVDWLINLFRQAKVQPKVILRKPTLFQHHGIMSSLANKRQKLKDKYFAKFTKITNRRVVPSNLLSKNELHTDVTANIMTQ